MTCLVFYHQGIIIVVSKGSFTTPSPLHHHHRHRNRPNYHHRHHWVESIVGGNSFSFYDFDTNYFLWTGLLTLRETLERSISISQRFSPLAHRPPFQSVGNSVSPFAAYMLARHHGVSIRARTW